MPPRSALRPAGLAGPGAWCAAPQPAWPADCVCPAAASLAIAPVLRMHWRCRVALGPKVTFSLAVEDAYVCPLPRDTETGECTTRCSPRRQAEVVHPPNFIGLSRRQLEGSQVFTSDSGNIRPSSMNIKRVGNRVSFDRYPGRGRGYVDPGAGPPKAPRGWVLDRVVVGLWTGDMPCVNHWRTTRPTNVEPIEHSFEQEHQFVELKRTHG